MAGRVKRLALGRWGLLFGLVTAWGAQTTMIPGRDSLMHPRGLATVVNLDFFTQWSVWIPLSLFYFLMVILFFLRIREIWTGTAIFLLIGLVTFLELCTKQADIPAHGKLLPSFVVASWVLGLFLFRKESPLERERKAQEIACGVFAALFTLAGLSKLQAMGWGWTDGNLHAMLFFERSYNAPVQLFGEIRYWISHYPALCGLGAATVLVMECAGVLFVFPRTRKLYAWFAVFALVAMMVLVAGRNLGWILIILALAYSRIGDKEAILQEEEAARTAS